MFCNNCGKPLPDGSKFCTYCGTPQIIVPAQNMNSAPQMPPPSQNMYSAPQTPPPVYNAPVNQPQGNAKPKKKSKAPKVLIIIVIILVLIGAIAFAAYWVIDKPNREWRAAQKLYDNGEYYEAYQAFHKAGTSDAKGRHNYDWMAMPSEALLMHCRTLEKGDTFTDYWRREWQILDKNDETKRIAITLNEPTHAIDPEEEYETNYQYFNYAATEMEYAAIAVEGEIVLEMTDEDAMATFGKTADQAAQVLFPDEYAANPDAEWFYPVIILDASFPHENPFWNSVMYGARFVSDTNELTYGPIKVTYSGETPKLFASYADYSPNSVNYSHVSEAYQEKTEADIIADLENAGASDVYIEKFSTDLLPDGHTKVETLITNYLVSDGSVVGLERIRCWDTSDPQSIIEMRWVVGDEATYDFILPIIDSVELADTPTTEMAGFHYLGYRTHVREINGTTEGPISHKYDSGKGDYE